MKDAMIRYILLNAMLSLGMVLFCGTQIFGRLTEQQMNLLSSMEFRYGEKESGMLSNTDSEKEELYVKCGVIQYDMSADMADSVGNKADTADFAENEDNPVDFTGNKTDTGDFIKNKADAADFAENREDEIRSKKEISSANNAEKNTADSYSAAASVSHNSMRIFLNKEDYQCLLKIVEAEAGVCDEKGKILVANVVLNRMEDAAFPDTVKGVVYQNHQFSPVANGTIDQVEISKETEQAVARALTGEDYSQGALYFAARRLSDKENMDWFDRNLCYLFEHDGHEFFKEKQ